MRVKQDQAGAVIGKNGNKIMDIREMSGARVTVNKISSSNLKEELRLIEIEGDQRKVAFAKHLINLQVSLHETSLEKVCGISGDSGNSLEDLPEMKAAATCLARISDL